MDEFNAQLAGLRQAMVDLDGDGVPDAPQNAMMTDRPNKRQIRQRAALFESMDPMTASQIESSRRAVADALFQQQAPAVAQGAFELTGLPTMARGVADIDQGIQTGNIAQGAAGVGQLALGALPFGSGQVLAKGIPFASRYAEKAANMTGLTGLIAQRAPTAAGLVGGVEVTKALTDSGNAYAAEQRMQPPPPMGLGAEAVQKFLIKQNYPIEADGAFGAKSAAAYEDYARRYKQFVANENSPVRGQEREAEAALKRANALKIEEELRQSIYDRDVAERSRRAGVLESAEGRHDNRAQTMGQKLTGFGQQMVGPAIMGASALLGAKGIAGAPSRNRSVGALNARASKMIGSRAGLTDAERKAFVSAYDKTVRGKPLTEAIGTASAYGALGTEMYLAGEYLGEARQEYQAALDAFEKSQKSSDGGKEKELADRVAKAKAAVDKWEGLQGAGLHGAGYLTAGKFGSKVVGNVKPSPDALFARNMFKNELKLKGKPNLKTLPTGASGSHGYAKPQSSPSQKSTDQTKPSGQEAEIPKDPKGRPNPNQETSQGGRGKGTQSQPFSSQSKKSIRDALSENDGKLTAKQAQELAPNVSAEKVNKYLAEQEKYFAIVGKDKYRLIAPGLASAAGATLIPFDEY